MLDNEKLLFDELYEKTKDCGRVQFVELLMTKERENKELKLQLKGTTHCFDEEEHDKLKKQVEEYKDKVNWENMLLKKENKQLKDNWNKLKEYFNERIEVCDNRLSSPFCNFEKATKERLIFSQCLEKLEELEGSDSNEKRNNKGIKTIDKQSV